jgi:hypothetical protein
MNLDDIEDSRDLMLGHVRRILEDSEADTAELEIVRKYLNDSPPDDPWYDDTMGQRVQEILASPDPSKGALELARKYLNDTRKRAFDRSLKELDPAVTAMQKYGIKFDDLPKTLSEVLNGEDDD